MRQRFSSLETLSGSESLEYGAVAGCDTAVLMPIQILSGTASVSIDGTFDGVHWFHIAGLQSVSMNEGELIEIPYAGCYRSLRATVSGTASIQWASKWSD